MTPGKEAPITSSARTSELLNQGATPKRVKKPISSTNDPTSAQGPNKPASHTNQESFIIPGTATGPDKPLMGPEKTSAAITPAVTGAGSVIKEQHQ